MKRKRMIEVLIGAMFLILLLILIVGILSFEKPKNKEKIFFEKTLVKGNVDGVSFESQSLRYFFDDEENYFEKNSRKEYIYSRRGYILEEEDSLYFYGEKDENLKLKII